MNSIGYYIKNPLKLGVALVHRMEWLPDKTYLRLLYLFEMGKWLNLKKPKTFQEKLQYLKLFNRNKEYIKLVDKYAVKEYVSNIIGSEYIIPTIGVWNHFDEINFDELPDQFVLKTTHGGGSCGVVICRDKQLLNKAEAKAKLESSLKTDIYKGYREWPYKDVPRKIIAEKFLDNLNGVELTDFKFFCFNGYPKFIQVITNRTTGETIDFFDINWRHQDFVGLNYDRVFSNSKKIIPKPRNLNKMIDIASKLCKFMPFVRIDMYNVNGKIWFGEITFFPASGLGYFAPKKWDIKIGNLIRI